MNDEERSHLKPPLTQENIAAAVMAEDRSLRMPDDFIAQNYSVAWGQYFLIYD